MSLVDADDETAREFCDAILSVKREVHRCIKCGNYTEDEICETCLTRDNSVICVVAYPKDIPPIEKTGFGGVYHVLGGTFSPREGRGIDDLRVAELVERMKGVKELIIATNPDLEGEATALYIATKFRKLYPDVKITRPAQGISVGSEMEFMDEATLTRAFSSRREM